MARKSFADVSKGGVGFQEGRVLIGKSYSTIFQFPPNSTTGVQSDAFTALVWSGHRLDKDGNEIDDGEVEIPIRMGVPGEINPGFIEPKDFDNLNVEPKDMGKELGVEGNSFAFIKADGKFNRAWSSVYEGLEKHGFRKEILGRSITTDFEGMDIQLKTVEGQKYIARQGKKKGEEVTPTSLVVERIYAFPYDAKKTGKTSKGTGAAAPPAAPAATATGATYKVNGQEVARDVVEVARIVFGNLSDKFKAAVPAEKAVKRVDFQKAITFELMRQQVDPVATKDLMDALKDDRRIVEISAATEAFTTDGATVTFL